MPTALPTASTRQPCRADTPPEGRHGPSQALVTGAMAPAPTPDAQAHPPGPPMAASHATGPHLAVAPAAAPHPVTPGSLPCWPSQHLLGRGVEALIRHGDALYRLRLTRQGKLILTK